MLIQDRDFFQDYIEYSNNTYGNKSIKSKLEELKSEKNLPANIDQLINLEFLSKEGKYEEVLKGYKVLYKSDKNNYIYSLKLLQTISFLGKNYYSEDDFLDNQKSNTLTKTIYYENIKNNHDFFSLKVKMLIHLQDKNLYLFKEAYETYINDSSVNPLLKDFYKSLYLNSNDDKLGLKILENLYCEQEIYSPIVNNYCDALWKSGKENEALYILSLGLLDDPNNFRMNFNYSKYLINKIRKDDNQNENLFETLVKSLILCLESIPKSNEVFYLITLFYKEIINMSKLKSNINIKRINDLLLSLKFNIENELLFNLAQTRFSDKWELELNVIYIKIHLFRFVNLSNKNVEILLQIADYCFEHKISSLASVFIKTLEISNATNYKMDLINSLRSTNWKKKNEHIIKAMISCETYDERLIRQYFITKEERISKLNDFNENAFKLEQYILVDYVNILLKTNITTQSFYYAMIYFITKYNKDNRKTYESIFNSLYKIKINETKVESKIINRFIVNVIAKLKETHYFYEGYQLTNILISKLDQNEQDDECFFKLINTMNRYGNKDMALEIIMKLENKYSTDDSGKLKLLNEIYKLEYYRKALFLSKKYLSEAIDEQVKNDLKTIFNLCNDIIINDSTNDKLNILMEDSYFIENSALANQKKLIDFIREKGTNLNRYYFHNLQKWNSFTPIIDVNNEVGGGQFFKLGKFGLVIDPGFDFIRNFIKYDYKFSDIDAVFISHAHNDHTADLESILTLLHKYNSFIDDLYNVEKNSILNQNLNQENYGFNFDGYRNFYEFDSKYKYNYEKIKQIECDCNKYHKKLLIYVSKSTFKKYAGLVNLYKKENYQIRILEEQLEIDLSSEISMINDQPFDNSTDIKIYPFVNNHNDIISDYSSYGLFFVIDKYIFVCTGDTGYSDALIQRIKAIRAKHLDKKFIILANIGGFKSYESKYKYNSDENLYKNHLGRIGLFKLTEELKPDLCLLSEFGMELKGYRVDISNIYNKYFSSTTKFIPCELGLKLNLIKGGEISLDGRLEKTSTKNELSKVVAIPINEVKYYNNKDNCIIFYK